MLSVCNWQKDFHCYRNTRSSSHKARLIKGPHKKNTNCSAKLSITVKKFLKKSVPNFLLFHAITHFDDRVLELERQNKGECPFSCLIVGQKKGAINVDVL